MQGATLPKNGRRRPGRFRSLPAFLRCRAGARCAVRPGPTVGQQPWKAKTQKLELEPPVTSTVFPTGVGGRAAVDV